MKKHPNAPCHWWLDLKPEDATESEIELIHKIAGDPMEVKGMTWQQARENYKGCAAHIRDLLAQQPAQVAVTDTKGNTYTEIRPGVFEAKDGGNTIVVTGCAQLVAAEERAEKAEALADKYFSALEAKR